MKRRICFVIFAVCIFFIGCNQKKFDAVKFFIDSNNIEKAELILDNMHKKEKKSFDYNYLKGIVLVKKSIAGYKRDALNYFLKANEYDSNNYFNNLMIVKMYVEVNDLKNAECYALKAQKLFLDNKINIYSYDDDVYYWLSKIYLQKRDCKKAYENIKMSIFQNDENIIFVKSEILDLLNNTILLDNLFLKYHEEKVLSDELQFEYMNYLFLQKRIKEADILAGRFLEEGSSLLKYYGCLFKAYINMLERHFEDAEIYIEKSYDYEVEDSLFFRYKMKTFYSYLTESNKIRIFNSFLIYKFFYEKDENESITAKEDLSEFYEYFKNDIYFEILKDYMR